MTLRLRGDDKVEGPVQIKLRTVISMSASLVGWLTVVMHDMSPKWLNCRLVAKISWVGDYRVSEWEFVDKAVEEATKPGP